MKECHEAICEELTAECHPSWMKDKGTAIRSPMDLSRRN